MPTSACKRVAIYRHQQTANRQTIISASHELVVWIGGLVVKGRCPIHKNQGSTPQTTNPTQQLRVTAASCPKSTPHSPAGSKIDEKQSHDATERRVLWSALYFTAVLSKLLSSTYSPVTAKSSSAKFDKPLGRARYQCLLQGVFSPLKQNVVAACCVGLNAMVDKALHVSPDFHTS